MKTTIQIIEITNQFNGWNMPIIKVKASTNLKVINRGYNEFQCLQDIDETPLLKLRELFPNNKRLHLSIETPERITNAWYNLESSQPINNIWW